MNINRFLALITPVIIYFFLEIYFLKPKFFFVMLVLTNLLIFFTVSQFSKNSTVDKKWWNFFILPLIFFSSIIIYTTLLINNKFIHFLFILIISFLYCYFRLIYYYLLRPTSYRYFTIESISSYGNFLSSFFVFSSIYGFISFLNIAVWPMMTIIFFSSFLMIYQTVWANKIDINKAIAPILISSLILFELAWSISFLPLNFNISGLLLAIFYYIITNLEKFHLLGGLNKKIIRSHVLFGIISIFLILLTARWM